MTGTGRLQGSATPISFNNPASNRPQGAAATPASGGEAVAAGTPTPQAQASINTQDSVNATGARSMELPNQVGFPQPGQQPQAALSPEVSARISELDKQRVELSAQLGRTNHEINRLSNSGGSPAQIAELRREVSRLESQITTTISDMTALGDMKLQRNQLANNLVRFGLRDVREGRELSQNTVLNQVLGTIDREAGSIADVTDSRDNGNLKLNDNNTFVYAMTLTQQWSPSQLNQLNATLAKVSAGADAGGAITAQDQEILHKVGLHAKDGQLHNLLTQKPLAPESVTQLQDVTVSMMRAAAEPESLQAMAINHLRGHLNNVIKFSTALVEARQNLDQMVTRLEQAEARVETATETLTATTTELDASSRRYAQAVPQFKLTADVIGEWAPPPREISGEMGPGITAPVVPLLEDDEPPPVMNRTPERVTQANQALERYNMSIQRDPEGNLEFRIDDKAVEEQVFWDSAKRRLGEEHGELSNLERRIGDLQRDAGDQGLALHAAITDANAVSREVTEAHSRYQGQMQATARDLATAEDFMSSEMGKALPESVRRAASPTIARAREAYTNEQNQAPTVRSRVERAINRINQVVGRGQRALDRSRDVSQQAGVRVNKFRSMMRALQLMMDKINLLPPSMNRTTQATAAVKAEIAANVARLVSEANELERRLTLVAAPEYEGVDELAEGIEEVLRQTETIFNGFARTETRSQEFDTRLDGEYLGKVRENNDYHSRKLSERSNLSRAEIAERAAEALRHVRGSMFVAQSVTAG